MADNWEEDDGWLSEAEARRIPDPNRGQILPLYKAKDGVELAWPQFVLDAYNAVTLPRDTLQGYEPTVGDTTNFALGVGGGGLTASSVVKPEADLGMFLGKSAKKADMNKFSKAMDLVASGADRDQIWQETGWWQKPDGDWAWEISDDEFDLSEAVKAKLGEPSSAPASAGYGDKKYTPPGAEASVTTDDVKGTLQHPKLQENYRLADGTPDFDFTNKSPEEIDDVMNNTLPVKKLILKTGDRYGGGMHSGSDVLVARGKDIEEMKSVALHELQHAVQNKEDWKGKGSNPEWTSHLTNKFMKTLPAKWHDYKDQTDVVKDLNTRIMNYEEKIQSWEKLVKNPEWKDEAFSNTKKFKQIQNELIEDYEDAMVTIRELWKDPDVQDGVTKANEFVRQFGEDAFKMYENNEGEMLSTLTQARRNMNDKERKAIPPWEHFGRTVGVSKTRVKDLAPEGNAWTDEDYNKFLEDYMKKPSGSLEGFNKRLSEAKAEKSSSRETKVGVEEFKSLLQNKKIRPASLNDVEGTHHKRKLYKHPNTGQWFVENKDV